MKKLLLITATAIPLVAAGTMPGWSQQPQQPNATQQANQQPSQSQQQGQQSQNQEQQVNLSQNEIKQMQGALDQKGYHSGRQDGKMGRMTEAALRQFQKDQGFQQTGKPDQRTLAALGINEQQGANQSQPSTVGQGNNHQQNNNQQNAGSNKQNANASQQYSGANGNMGHPSNTQSNQPKSGNQH